MRGNGGRERPEVVVITGASAGVGRATVREFAKRGASIGLLARGREGLEAARREVEELGGRAVVLPTDVADAAHVEAAAARVEEEFGPIDIWINNAGADILTGADRQRPFEQKLSELWLVDVRATMLLSRAVGRRLRERGRGVILNMGWDQAETGMEGDSGELFAATKGAVMAFSRSLALSLAPEVRVNCLAPGWIRTAWGEHAPAAWQERVLRETPLGRWGMPEDVARAALWLASPPAAYISGQIVRINGGAVRG